jgi:Na+/H+ antiporter NhaD/arsenite permease-like protein
MNVMPVLITVGVFLIVYIFIVTEAINKTMVALLGAGLLLVTHVIPAEHAVGHIDVNVIFLLLFMMIIVNITEQSGFFEWLTIVAAKKVRAQPIALLIVLFLVTAFLSAVLDNVTTILLVAPVSILLASQLKITPVPFLIIQVLGSNIGGTATLIGDPPNIMIGSAANLSFFDFIVNVAFIIAIMLVVLSVIFALFFRKKFEVTAINRARVMEIKESKLIKDPVLLRKSLIVLSLVITGFLLHGWLHVEASIIAMIGATSLAIWSKLEVEPLFHKVEWGTILFFVGLFVLVGGLEYAGVIDFMAKRLIYFSHGDLKLTSQILLWSSGILSGFIDNIPLTATFIPVIHEMGSVAGEEKVHSLWWSLSLGACLGGNLTAIGASANVVMLSIAKKNGYTISFKKFLLYGVPVTLLTLLIASIYVFLRY